jgi:predicted AlkP superfamily pyrophosphatase or phosphodiesterase
MAAKAATKVLLTKEEQALLKKLAPNVQALFKDRVEAESLTSFETEEELVERMSKASYEQYPEVKTMMEKLVQSGDMTDLNLEKLSDGALDVLLFTIGACGISALIELSLQDSVGKDDVEALATLSLARHRVLTVNSSK